MRVCGTNAPVQTETFRKTVPPFKEISLKLTVVRIVRATHPHKKKPEERPPPAGAGAQGRPHYS